MLKNNLDFKHIDKIIKKGLTNPDYYRVLGIIGQSEESLDNTQIIANFEKIYGPWNKYKYEILKELSPIDGNVTDELLFIWEDLKILELAQLEEKCSKILEKINQSFYIKIDNHLKENYIFLRDGDSLEESNKWIKIQSNEKNAESFNPYFDEGILIIIFSKSQVWIFPTLTIKKKGKLHVYSKSQISIEKRQFLNTTTKKQISFLYTPGHKSENNEKNNWPRTHQLLNEICEMRESYPIDIDKYLREWLLNQIADSKKENLQETIQDYLKYIHEKIDELNKIT